MGERESLYHKYPDYRVDLDPTEARVCVRWEGRVIADSRKTLTVRETKHQPVVYFPRADVDFSLLERTDHSSFCPFKGEASYWSLRQGDAVDANAVWSYEDPFDEVALLTDFIAFYEDRVEWADE